MKRVQPHAVVAFLWTTNAVNSATPSNGFHEKFTEYPLSGWIALGEATALLRLEVIGT